MTITNEYREDLYRFIWNEISKHGCHLTRIGGVQNHVHLLVDLHPNISLAKLVGDVKAVTSAWLKRDGRFPSFIGWADGYFAATISEKDKRPVIDYINEQQEKHLHIRECEEFQRLYESINAKYDDTLMR